MSETKTRSKNVQAEAPVSIDFPVENEEIFPGHYAIRLFSPENKPMEISIDNGPWVACRAANGYFWFDWWPVKGGKSRISARVVGSNAKKATTRTCVVHVPHSN